LEGLVFEGNGEALCRGFPRRGVSFSFDDRTARPFSNGFPIGLVVLVYPALDSGKRRFLFPEDQWHALEAMLDVPFDREIC
jgi:hypothetical protein